jgi:hypothetical protein
MPKMVGTPAALPTYDLPLMPQLRLHNGLANFGAAIGALIGEVNLGLVPMRFDVADIHWKPDTARTKDETWLNAIMMNIGWHVGSPHGSNSRVAHHPKRSIRACG